ncbi:MAG: chromosomal replication initiator protein DnaA [Leptospiraceae bacterium]|nr:chromosomal replication initiator protein DnaA [Leptospiraceae bacterium]
MDASQGLVNFSAGQVEVNGLSAVSGAESKDHDFLFNKEEKDAGVVLWHSIYEKLGSEIPSQFFTAFFERVKALGKKGNRLVLESESGQVITHIRHRYMELLRKIACEIAGDTIDVDLTEKSKEPNLVAPKENIRVQDSQLKSMAVTLNPNYTFERFVKGPTNEHALAAAMGAAANPSDFHNPLYIYGSVGLGKTHLMMALGNYVEANMSWLKVAYVPSESFQNELIYAFQNKSVHYFDARYKNVDVFLFDDIQLISNKADATQEKIFEIFNTLYQNRKQVVISGDRPPQSLSRLHDRLQSRFQSGLIVDIKQPNLETRLAILQARSEEMQLKIPFEALKFIAVKFTTQVRQLEAALIKLKFTSEYEKHPIDLQMAKLALRDMPGELEGPQVSIDEILRIVARTFHIDEKEIKGQSRVENIALARHTCMYLAKKLIPGMSLQQIAQAFGRTDHSTVIHAEKKITEYMDSDEGYAIQLQELMEDLQF